MNDLEGRVAIVTGAGRGLGRSHALYLAQLGASVVVNDLGCSLNGEGRDRSTAYDVAEEIRNKGGQAVVSTHDISRWQDARSIVELAIKTFGGLHILVNNAGILRDRSFTNMSESEWDTVINIHLKGHAAPSHHAMKWWRKQSKAGEKPQASIIHTTSLAGLYPNFGQANYCAAKMAVVALSQVLAMEGAKYGVRSNAVAPSAQTRLLEGMGASAEEMGFTAEQLDPVNVSKLVAWLAKSDCPSTSQTYHVLGKRITLFDLVSTAATVTPDDEWDMQTLDAALDGKMIKMKTGRKLIIP